MDFLKLFLSLYYRPFAALSRIIDEGGWLQGAVMVLGVSVSVLLGLAQPLHRAYEAAPLSPQQVRERFVAQQIAEGASDEEAQQAAQRITERDQAALLDAQRGSQRLPLPLAGNWGWWFVSFSAKDVLTTLLALALFYVPGTILLLVWVDYLGSFGVVLRRDYGALLACTLPNVRSIDAQALVASDIRDAETLAKQDAKKLLAAVEAFLQTPNGKNIARNAKAPTLDIVKAWIDAAKKAPKQASVAA